MLHEVPVGAHHRGGGDSADLRTQVHGLVARERRIGPDGGVEVAGEVLLDLARGDDGFRGDVWKADKRAAEVRAHEVGVLVGSLAGGFGRDLTRGCLRRGVLGLVLLDGRLEDVVIAVRAEHLAEESDTAAVSLGVLAQPLHREHDAVHLGEGEAEADGLVHRRISNDILGLELVEEVFGGLDGFAGLGVNLALGRAVQLLEGHRGGDVFGICRHKRGVRGFERGLLRDHGRFQQIDRILGLLVEDLTCWGEFRGSGEVSGVSGKSPGRMPNQGAKNGR